MKTATTLFLGLFFGIIFGAILATNKPQNIDDQLARCQEDLEITSRILENPHHCVSVCNEVFVDKE